MNALWLDIRYAMRTLLQRPGFLAVAVVTLGLGAGANAAIFSIVNTILLRPLPYPEGDRIVRIVQDRGPGGGSTGLPSRTAALSTADLQEWRRQTTTLSQMAAYGPATLTMTDREQPVRLAGTRVSPALFPLLRVSPLMGRTFQPDEEKAGADAVAVLSFTAWQKYFAVDPGILSRKLTLDGRAYSVVGVMPQGFEFPDGQTEIWLPFVLLPSTNTPGQRIIQLAPVIARVKDGVSMDAARAEARVIFDQLRANDARLDARRPPLGGPQPVGPASDPASAEPQPHAVAPDAPAPGGPPPRGDAPNRGYAAGGAVALGQPSAAGQANGPAPVRRSGEPGPEGAGPGPRRIERPFSAAPVTVELSGLKDEIVRPVKPALLVLLASVGFVLLIACANVANLLLARAAGRRQEIAVRAALGAGRLRLVRQVLTESLVLALLGGALGTALAWGAVSALRVLGPADIPRLDQLRVDLPFFAFTLGLSLFTGVLFGIVPALRLSRMDEAQAMKQGATFPASGLRLFGHNRTRSLLAIGELALAMMLLVGAGLLINSFLKLSNVHPGYDPTNVLAFRVALPQARSQAQRDAFYRQMLERLRAQPGVRAAAVSNTLPLQQGVMRIALNLQGRPEPTSLEDAATADVRIVSTDYVTTMGIRLVSGRNLRPITNESQPREVLVNESFVRRYLADTRPVGARVHFTGPEPWEVVGVVNDVRHAGLTAEPYPELYVDYHQAAAILPGGGGLRDAFFAIRTAGSPAPLMAAVRGLVQQVDPQLVVENLATMDQRLSASVARPRFYATMMGVFAGISVILAAVGIYGVLAYTVSQSTREIGIRLALGASQRGVLTLVLEQGLVLAAIGIVLGLFGAAAVTRSLTTLLFGLTPFDPATFGLVSVLLALVALVACYLPARRAMRVDPIVALRHD